MNIVFNDAFDIYGDGTLVLRIIPDEYNEDFRYAWYVKLNNKIIHEVKYQKKPFASVKLKKYGEYTIKAFIMDKNKQKDIQEITFICNENTSPDLNKFAITPVVKCVSGAFWEFSVKEKYEEKAKYAWYIYKDGEKEPILKLNYSYDPSFIHEFKENGTYYIKAYVIKNDIKCSKLSKKFKVSI